MSLKLLRPIRIQFFVNVRDLNHPKNVSFFILCCKSQCKLLVKLVKIQFLIKYNVSYDFYTDLIDSVKTVWIIEDGGDFQHLYSLYYFSIMFHMKWKSNEREIDRESLFTQTPNLLFQAEYSKTVSQHSVNNFLVHKSDSIATLVSALGSLAIKELLSSPHFVIQEGQIL